VTGTGFDSSAVLDYIVPEKAVPVADPEFDYDLLVRPLEARMMRTIWRIVRHREAAEDALQDALAVVWKKRETVARHPKPEALILRIAITAAIDAVRKDRRRLRHETSRPTDDRADGATPPVGDEVEARDLRAAVLEAIRHLPPRQAAALLLHVVEEQPYADVARAMGCSESTVRVHVLRGRALLARHLAHRVPRLNAGDGKEGGS
jgi:RNA polymerase sigma-70 factor (ECF subfamily)